MGNTGAVRHTASYEWCYNRLYPQFKAESVSMSYNTNYRTSCLGGLRVKYMEDTLAMAPDFSSIVINHPPRTELRIPISSNPNKLRCL